MYKNVLKKVAGSTLLFLLAFPVHIAIAFVHTDLNNEEAKWFHDSSERADRLKGRILLQIEEHGEAWYVDTVDHRRYYLGRPADAFDIMRYLGHGISNEDLEHLPLEGQPSSDYGRSMAERLKGKILLQVEENGEAWYVDPSHKTRTYLGTPQDAFTIMRERGLGITNTDLFSIRASIEEHGFDYRTEWLITNPNGTSRYDIDLVNKGRFAVDMSGWTYVMDDEARFTIPNDTPAIPPNSKVRISRYYPGDAIQDPFGQQPGDAYFDVVSEVLHLEDDSALDPCYSFFESYDESEPQPCQIPDSYLMTDNGTVIISDPYERPF